MTVLQEILMGCGWEPYQAQCLAPVLGGVLFFAVGAWALGVVYDIAERRRWEKERGRRQ